MNGRCYMEENRRNSFNTTHDLTLTAMFGSGSSTTYAPRPGSVMIASPPPVPFNPLIKEGWLTKQGSWVKNWKRRWFVLRGKSLSYYVNRTSQTPQGTIELSNIKVVKQAKNHPFNKSVDLVFSVITSQRTYFFECDNEQDYSEWTSLMGDISIGRGLTVRSPNFGPPYLPYQTPVQPLALPPSAPYSNPLPQSNNPNQQPYYMNQPYYNGYPSQPLPQNTTQPISSQPQQPVSSSGLYPYIPNQPYPNGAPSIQQPMTQPMQQPMSQPQTYQGQPQQQPQYMYIPQQQYQMQQMQPQPQQQQPQMMQQVQPQVNEIGLQQRQHLDLEPTAPPQQ